MQDYFFPKNCLNCHKEGKWLCEGCSDSLFFVSVGFCPFCGNLADLFSVCKKCRNATGIEKVFSILKYSDLLTQKIIKNFKYRYIKGIAGELAPLWQKFLLKYKILLDIKDETAIVPVPLHWYKERVRGFNQAGELAEIVGKILDIPVMRSLVKKIKRTKNQAEIVDGSRFNNLSGSLRVKKNPPKSVIIIDDVFTTGSTVRELAKVLRVAGTENIQIITLARG